MKIVLCYPIDPPQLRQIAEVSAACGLAAEIPVEIINAGQERIATEILEADIYCGHAKVPVPWDAVVKQGRLRWIQSSAAGMDHCLVPPVVESNITVSSASGLLANQVTDHTLALTLGFLRSLPVFFRAGEAGVHPPANARFALCEGRDRGIRRQRPAAGESVAGVSV